MILQQLSFIDCHESYLRVCWLNFFTDLILYLFCSVTQDDFNGYPLSYTINRPGYVPSPYGAWLAISNTPSLDSFSDWFRYVDGTNYEFNNTVILKGYSSEGTNRYDLLYTLWRQEIFGEVVSFAFQSNIEVGCKHDWRLISSGKWILLIISLFRLYSDDFYPVDYLGWLDEGEKDCDGVPSNLAFTSAIRTGFVYQGNESISISGGEMMWLYLNRKVVLQVFNDEADSTKICKRLNISEAAETGKCYNEVIHSMVSPNIAPLCQPLVTVW